MSYYELESIPCPNCGHISKDQWESVTISYWGSDGNYDEIECAECETKFKVKEIVSRMYEIIE